MRVEEGADLRLPLEEGHDKDRGTLIADDDVGASRVRLRGGVRRMSHLRDGSAAIPASGETPMVRWMNTRGWPAPGPARELAGAVVVLR